MPRPFSTSRSERQPHRGDEPRVGPLAAKLSAVPTLKIDALLADRSVDIIVCCGSGGVGKASWRGNTMHEKE